MVTWGKEIKPQLVSEVGKMPLVRNLRCCPTPWNVLEAKHQTVMRWWPIVNENVCNPFGHINTGGVVTSEIFC